MIKMTAIHPALLLLSLISFLCTNTNAFHALPVTHTRTTTTTTTTPASFSHALVEQYRTVIALPKSCHYKKQKTVLYQSDHVMECAPATATTTAASSTAARRITQFFIPTRKTTNQSKPIFPLLKQMATFTTSTTPSATARSISRRSITTSLSTATSPPANIAIRTREQSSVNSSSLVSLLQTMKQLVKESWWTTPMWLCLVPVWMQLVHGQPATTPHFWKMTNMHGMWEAPYQSVTLFLFSNIVYFIAAWYLIAKYSTHHHHHSNKNNHQQTQQQQSFSTLPESKNSKSLAFFLSLPPKQPFPITKYTALGLWVGLAGLVSTVFHAFQAMCSGMMLSMDPTAAAATTAAATNAMAESWCYVDHGIAGTAILYFWHVCGSPYGTRQHPRQQQNDNNALSQHRGSRVMILSLLGFLALITPHAYTFMHAMWHVLSAAAAVCWGMQPLQQQQSLQ